MIAFLLLLNLVPAFAQTEHALIRRVSVFPIRVTDPELETVADAAWWEMREALAKDKRFLIASRNFLQQKDVFQERGELSPADAIILGKILDANALITTHVEDRVLHMDVYEGEWGRPLWRHRLTLQPSLPVAEQLQTAVLKLTQDFVAAVPYQGFVKLDPLKGGVIYKEGKRSLVRAEIGSLAEVDVGDAAQLIRITSDSIKPLFASDARQEVFADGHIIARDRETVTIELERLTKANQIREGTLVRLPRELKRLEQLYAIHDSLSTKIDPIFFSPGMTSAKQKVQESKPLITSLAFITNIAAILLLAF